ncbi:DNA translocase FtsK 4TM domain-containing protein [candidate division KSB1 bacterium]|nr:DNA translocase FtsK 4TM domain-containing protein [candidate division KSB1 bacterium]
MRKRSKKVRAPRRKPKLDERKSEELLGIMLILFGILLGIALFSFHPDEVPGEILADEVRNQLGIAGVFLSYYLIHATIGYPIVVLPFIIILWGLYRLLGKDTRPVRRWSLFTFLIAFYISMAGALYYYISVGGADSPYQYAGFLGVLGATLLRKLLGVYGAVITIVGLIVINVLLFTSFTLREFLVAFSAAISRFNMKIRKTIKEWRSRRRISPQTFMKTMHPPISPEPTISKSTLSGEEEKEKLGEEDQPALSRAASRPKITPQKQLEFTLEDSAREPEPALEDAPSEPYEFPPLSLLQLPEKTEEPLSEEVLRANAHQLQEKLADFDIKAHVVEIHPGPIITRYELQLAPGIKVSRITSLADDLAMAMRAKRIRIVAPIPGKAAVGVEIPNPSPSMVYLREILSAPQFQDATSPLTIGLGKTISGAPFITDLATMPHLLVAGSTGSGKSVCLNTIIASFLYKAHPSQVQLVLIDPKRLELSTYANLHNHHLACVEGVRERVATSAKTAIAVLKSVEQEMEKRYEILATAGVRNIEEYNERVAEGRIIGPDDTPVRSLHYLVVIVDELADLMLTSSASRDVEEPIARLTQMSRAVGIHLIVATQRPSVDVITGVIKANFPARMAFQVATKIDSRTILDMNGAEKLLGKGDMLFLPPGSPEVIRIHNAFISLGEIEKILEHINQQPKHSRAPLPAYIDEETASREGMGGGKRDPLFNDALRIVVRTQQGSVSILQRRLKVGYSRAARLIDELEDAGIVGPFEGSKAREVLMAPEELESLGMEGDEEEESL